MDYDNEFKQWCCDGNNPESYIHIDNVSDDMIEECMMNILMDCI